MRATTRRTIVGPRLLLRAVAAGAANAAMVTSSAGLSIALADSNAAVSDIVTGAVVETVRPEN